MKKFSAPSAPIYASRINSTASRKVPLPFSFPGIFFAVAKIKLNGFQMNMKRTAIGAILIGCMVSLVACKQQETGGNVPTVCEVMTVSAGPTEINESYSASIRGRQDIEIYPQVSGKITELCVTEGQKVKKGEVMFVIDQVPYRAALRTAVANVHAAEAQVETARLDYTSKQQLFAEQVVSEYDLSTARNALAVAEASLEQAHAQETDARNNLSYTEVKSPSDGVVGTLPYRVGALVGASLPQPLTTVSDNSSMYVYFSMTENQLRALLREYGSPDSLIRRMPSISLQLNDGTLYAGKGHIESISGVINRQTGTVSVRSVFPNEDRLLLSGGIGNIIIPHRDDAAIVIPQTATTELQDKILAYKVAKDNTVSSVEIKVEKLNDGKQYIVRSGLAAGDVIVAEGVGTLRDGVQITIKDERKEK